MTREKALLLVGDLMLDKHWVVIPTLSPTAKRQGEAFLGARANPGFADTRLGGAGCFAAAIATQKKAVPNVTFLCSHHPDDTALIAEVTKQDQIENLTLKNEGNKNAITIVKRRFYSRAGRGGVHLEYRADSDPSPRKACSLLPEACLKDKEGYSAAVILDFNKGLITPAFLQALAATYSEADVFLDSKSTENIEAFLAAREAIKGQKGRAWLVLNREEYSKLALKGHDGEPVDSPGRWICEVLKGGLRVSDREVLAEVLAVSAHNLVTKWSKRLENVIVVVKLDRDGAAIIFRNGTTKWKLDICWLSNPVDAEPLAAGEIFLAKLVAAAGQSAGYAAVTGKCLKEAVREAAQWVEFSERRFWTHGEKNGSISEEVRADIPRVAEFANFVSRLEEERGGFVHDRCKSVGSHELENLVEKIGSRDSGRYLEVLRGPIMEQMAEQGPCKLVLASERFSPFLKGYSLFDREKGSELRELVAKVQVYKELEVHRRPLNVLVWAPPGAGKSFLAKSLSKAWDVSSQNFYTINLATLTGREQLARQLAALPHRRNSGLTVVLIDELLTQPGNNEYYLSTLIGPMWGGQVVLDLGLIDLPLPLVFIFVDSLEKSETKKVDNVEAFRKHLEELPKGKDFVSRLNGPQYSVQVLKPNTIDQCALIGINICRAFPQVKEIELGALRDLTAQSFASVRELEDRIGALSIRYGETRITTRHVETIIGNKKGEARLDGCSDDAVVSLR